MDNKYNSSLNFFKEKYQFSKKQTSQLILAVWELKTPENAGSIIRLAANLGIKQVFFINENFEMRHSKIKRVAQGSLSHVTYKVVNEKEFWLEMPADYSTIALETSTKSTNIFNTNFQANSIIIAGNERFGLPDVFLKKCRSSVFIPIPGETSSMNVSHALAIAAYEWARQNLPVSMNIS